MDFVQVFLRKLLLHEFVRRVEQCLVRKKPAMGIFLDIVGAFDNVTFRGFATALRGLGIRDGADNKKCIRMLCCVRKLCPHAAPHRIQTQLSSRCTAPHPKLNII